MNSKSLIVAVVVIVLIGGVYMWKGGTTAIDDSVKIAPVGEEQTGVQGAGEQTSDTTGSIGKMTDDIYVEIMAQIAYGTRDPMAWVTNNGMEKLLNKYGVTEENYTAYGEEVNKDTTRASAVVQKYSLRLQELQKTGK